VRFRGAVAASAIAGRPLHFASQEKIRVKLRATYGERVSLNCFFSCTNEVWIGGGEEAAAGHRDSSRVTPWLGWRECKRFTIPWNKGYPKSPRKS